MFENAQILVFTAKALLNPKNAAGMRSQIHLSKARLLMQRVSVPPALHQFKRGGGSWHAKNAMSAANERTDQRLGAGTPADAFSNVTPRALWRDIRLSFSLGIALLSMAGMGAAHAASGHVTIESGGVKRTAILVEHARLKKTRRPVVIILHSGGGSAGRVRHMLGLEEKARSASPVMVYPEAIDHHWSDAAKPGDTHDSAFIHDLVVKLVSEGIADKHRIFLVGASSGGMMALKLACSGTDDFAGIVAIFATLPADLAPACKPARHLPFLLVLGTADPFVPYNGGEANLPDSTAKLLSARATLDLFAKAAGCGDGHTTTAFADRQLEPSRAYLEKLNGCKDPVEFLRIEGGGHLLPRLNGLPAAVRIMDGERGSVSPGIRNRDVDGPLLIWDFLRHLGA